MLVATIASSAQDLRHGFRVRHELGWFERWHSATIGSRGCESELTLISLHEMHIMVSQNLGNAALVPRYRGRGVLMDKESSSLELCLVQGSHELEVHTPLSQHRSHSSGVHLAEIHVVIPRAECGARWRPDDEIGLGAKHKIARLSAVRFLGKIPI